MASSTPMRTAQAVSRARLILRSGVQLEEAAAQLSRTRRENKPRDIVGAAESLKEDALLNYRLSSMPENLRPVLEALLTALGQEHTL